MDPLTPHCVSLAHPNYVNFGFSLYVYLATPRQLQRSIPLTPGQLHLLRHPRLLPPTTLPRRVSTIILWTVSLLRPARDRVRHLRFRDNPYTTYQSGGLGLLSGG